MTKKVNRVRNWRKYNEALVNRGSVTFWIDEEIIKGWHENKHDGSQGRPKLYSDLAIKCALTVKAVFNLAFRATEGFIKSLMKVMKIDLKTPDYTLLCKRQKDLKIDLPRSCQNATILVDSTGIKVFGEGEWKVRQHGYIKKRLWRKLHIGVNAESQEINAFELTELGIQDCQGFDLLINKIERCERVIGDGAYDRFSCYELAEKKRFELLAPPQHNARTSIERSRNKKKASMNAVKKRDAIIEAVRKSGRKEWKINAGYHQRSLAETAVYRLKGLIRNKVRNKLIEHQKIEVGIWCYALNKMTTLGFGK